MTKLLSTSAAIIVATTLSGCGGGGADAIETTSEVGIDSASASAAFRNLNDGFVNIRADAPEQTDLPASGTAEYVGYLGFDASGAVPGGGNDNDSSFVGDLNVDVTFGSSATVQGSVTDLIYFDSNGDSDAVDGTLNVSGGITDLMLANGSTREGVIFADVTGPVTIDQPSGAKNVALDLDLTGQFGGSSPGVVPTAMQGFVVGNVNNNFVGGTGDLTLTVRNGRFAADTAGTNLVPD